MERTIKDIGIGDEFSLKEGGQVWVKRTIQGMGSRMSYCETKDKKGTRRYGHKSTRWKLFEQTTKIVTSEPREQPPE